ncbi:MAG: hypothetical protein ACI8ZF_000307 [Candidatus Midichloriaceae bacterium]|jgi:hypothetical protein
MMSRKDYHKYVFNITSVSILTMAQKGIIYKHSKSIDNATCPLHHEVHYYSIHY